MEWIVDRDQMFSILAGDITKSTTPAYGAFGHTIKAACFRPARRLDRHTIDDL